MWDTMTHGDGHNWDTLVSAVGEDCKVLAVMVGYDCYRNQQVECYSGEAFVDDIVVNGRTWDLEPLDTTCVKSEALPAESGYPIQIEVDDPTANVEGHEDLEESTTAPDGSEDTFNLAHAPKAVGTTSAYDLGGPLTVTDVAQTPTGGTVTVATPAPPAYYQVFPGTGCAHAEADMNPSVITLTTPTQLTVTSLNHIVGPLPDPDCTETAPGAGEWMYIFISGYTLPNSQGTPINELLYILGDTMTTATTTQTFGTIIAEGIDATYSTGSFATALFISADNHVWVTYDWHQADTVTVFAQTDEQMVEVTCIEVDPITLEPDKDSGYFKGILYPVTSSTNIELSQIPGLQRHDLYAPHCKTIELKYPIDDPQYAFAWFGVDNEPPVFSNQSPDPATNLSQPTISVDISDTKCDVTKDKISLYVSANDPPTDGEVAPADFDFANGTVTYTPSLPLVDGTYYVRVKAADCCWNWGEIDWSFEVESTPPMMIDAITGWTWRWGPRPMPQNTHTRDSIMVVFSERLDPTTVQKTDFTVNYATPVSATYYEYDGNWGCMQYCCSINPGCHEYGLVFLTLATPLATDATPTVVQVGVVEDLAGNACDKPYTWYCSEPHSLELPQTVTAQDGIGPAITVTASPEDPGYNETVTVTAVSSEPLSGAYLFVGEGSPNDYNWDECKPIGWDLVGPPVPCDTPPWHVPSTEWDGAECDTCDSRCLYGEWMLMTEGATPYVWTASFTNEVIPNKDWFVEVAAHDFTQWWVDMDDPEDLGQWQDYECNWHDKCWKHEKWTEESLIFWSRTPYDIDLCEGWNLISVPWNLVDPSLKGFFGTRTNTGITKVYYYTGGQYGYWQYAALHPVTGYWSGAITSIEPGKAYWVWVSPPEMRLWMHTLEPDALTPPPTYSVVKGWNMLGYTMLLDESPQTSPPQQIKHYLIGLRHLGPTHLYFYDPCDHTGDGPGWVRIHSGGEEYWNWYDEDMIIGMGFWFWAHDAATFGP